MPSKEERLQGRVAAAANKLCDQAAAGDIETIGLLAGLAEAAARYFADCPDDFCVQHAAYECVIFGGTNRLIWRPALGFYPDSSYCTPGFLETCRRLGRNPGATPQ